MKHSARLLSLLAFLATVFPMPSARALTAEQWTGLPTNPSALSVQREGIAKRVPNTNSTMTVATLSNLTAGTGVRLRGQLTPTVSGNYTLSIAGSNNTTLWLSTSNSRFTKRLIAWQYSAS